MSVATTTTTQRSDVQDWWLTGNKKSHGNAVVDEVAAAKKAPENERPKATYDDLKEDYRFLVAVSIGDSRQESWYHPSHSILEPLKLENIDLSRLPTNRERAIRIEHNSIPFNFHKIPNPVIDLHRIEPHKALASEIFATLTKTLNKVPTDESYEFDLLQPVILNFSKTYNMHTMNPEFTITYPGIGGETIHEIKSNFGNENIYAHSDIGESLFLGWLKNSADKIAKSLFA